MEEIFCKQKTGVVTSNKMEKTIAVTVEKSLLHPKHGRKYVKSQKYFAMTKKIECNIGDLVRIMETRPLSKK